MCFTLDLHLFGLNYFRLAYFLVPVLLICFELLPEILCFHSYLIIPLCSALDFFFYVYL